MPPPHALDGRWISPGLVWLAGFPPVVLVSPTFLEWCFSSQHCMEVWACSSGFTPALLGRLSPLRTPATVKILGLLEINRIHFAFQDGRERLQTREQY